MIALIQRVSEASITADGEFRGSIGQGLMVLVCGEKNDKLEYADALAEKVVGYRVFSDADGKMNLSLKPSTEESSSLPSSLWLPIPTAARARAFLRRPIRPSEKRFTSASSKSFGRSDLIR